MKFCDAARELVCLRRRPGGNEEDENGKKKQHVRPCRCRYFFDVTADGSFL